MSFAEDYIDVPTRIADFREKYPEGSLRPLDPAKPYAIEHVIGYDRNGDEVRQTFIVYTAAAYRHPEDPCPGVGTAWEIWPGRTPYTRDSELQNAETSAWGRAIVAALTSDAKTGVASREEVRNRMADRGALERHNSERSNSATDDGRWQETPGSQAAYESLSGRVRGAEATSELEQISSEAKQRFYDGVLSAPLAKKLKEAIDAKHAELSTQEAA